MGGERSSWGHKDLSETFAEVGWWKSWGLLGSVLLIWGWMGRKEACAGTGLQRILLGQVSDTKSEVDWEHPSACGR